MLDTLYAQMINLVSALLNAVLGLLPRSPFSEWIASFQAPQWVGWLNWFFPVGRCIAIMAVWLVAVALYYAYSIILRWIKVVG